MSIGFDKRDYAYYSSDDDEDGVDVDYDDGYHDEDLYQKTRRETPALWVDDLYFEINDMAKDKSLYLFDDMRTYDLADFIGEYCNKEVYR